MIHPAPTRESATTNALSGRGCENLEGSKDDSERSQNSSLGKAHGERTAVQRQRRANHLRGLIVFSVALLCVSIAWKRTARSRETRQPASLHQSEKIDETAPNDNCHMRPLSDGAEKTEVEAKVPSVIEFFKRAGNFECPDRRTFTKAEVALHSTKNNLYVVVNGNVLDVSSFVSQHPGGEVLLDGAGGDDMATVFTQFHHPSTVRLFSTFCVGRIRQ